MQGVDLMRESWQLRNGIGSVFWVPGGSVRQCVYVMYVTSTCGYLTSAEQSQCLLFPGPAMFRGEGRMISPPQMNTIRTPLAPPPSVLRPLFKVDRVRKYD
jgi:hypothetical protein